MHELRPALRLPCYYIEAENALADVMNVPIWRFIHDLIEQTIAALPQAQRRKIVMLAKQTAQ